MVKKVKLPYKPREWQMELHKARKRFTVLVAHRRAGKTVGVINELIKSIATCELNNPVGAYICPTERQAKRNAWSYLLEFSYPIPGMVVSKSENSITFPNGGKILVLGADDPDSLRGAYLDDVVLDESADFQSSYLWDNVLSPMLSDRKGKAIITGTAKGQTFLYKMKEYALTSGDKDWTFLEYTPDKTGALDQEEIDRAERTSQPGVFEQEYLCDFEAHLRGTYWGKEIRDLKKDGYVTEVPYDKEYPVYAGWDMGLDGTVIWYAQIIGDAMHIIDCDILIDKDLVEASKEVNKKPYNIVEMYLPHDAKKRLVGNRHKTRKQIIEDATGIKCKVLVKPNDAIAKNEEINVVRLRLPKCRFDTKKCREGLRSLSLYRAKYDPEKEVSAQTPIHDKHSHAADSFRSLILGLNNSSFHQEKRRPSVQGTYNHFDTQSFVNNKWDPFNK